MNKKCIGCGAILQSSDIEKPGYIEKNNIDFNLCRRCFRLKNYGEYLTFVKDNPYFKRLLNNISKSKSLVVHVIDVLDLYDNDIFNSIKSNSILVLTKRDVLPKSIKEEKLLKKVKEILPNYLDYIVISSKKNYNFDLLMEKIMKYKKDNKVYFVGFTNSGKSTLINRIISNYSDLEDNITTSYYPSTTLDMIEIKINDDLTIIDTPGILQNGNIINYIDLDKMKKIVLNNEMKPKIFQIKKECSIIIDEFCKIDLYEKNDVVIYCSNKLKIIKRNINNDELSNYNKKRVEVLPNEDLVISGLCFIKVKNKCNIDIYIDDNIMIYKRSNLI